MSNARERSVPTLGGINVHEVLLTTKFMAIEPMEEFIMTTEQMELMELIEDCKRLMVATQARLEECIEDKDWNGVKTMSDSLAEKELWIEEIEEKLSALSDTTEEEIKMTEQTRLQEVIQEMHLSLDGVDYDNNAERFNDYRFECLNASENIDMVIANIIDCGADDAVSLATLAGMKKERLVYIEAAEYFSNKADTTEEETIMTEEVTVVEEVVATPVTPVVDAAADVADVEEDVTMTEQTVVEVAVEEAVPNSQEAALKELKVALDLRHVELSAKFQDALAKGKEEAVNGSVEVAAIYRDMAVLLEQQLQELEAKLTKTSKQLTKLRIARTVAAPVIAVVVTAKAVVRVAKLVAHVVISGIRVIVRAGQFVGSVVRRVFTKKTDDVATVVPATTEAAVPSATVATAIKATVAVTGVAFTRTASGVRKATAAIRAAYGRMATAVLGASIVITATAHKAGSLLNDASVVVHASVATAIDTVKGLRFGRAAA